MNEDKCFEIDFYEWYDNRLMDGYNLSLSKEEVKRFVNKLVYWYESVVPRCSCFLENTDEEISYLFIDELKKRLTFKELGVLECYYRGKSICGGDATIVLYFPYKDNLYKRGIVYVDKYGFIEKHNIQGFEDVNETFKKGIYIDYLANRLKKVEQLNTKELDEFVKLHEIDILFREQVIMLAGLTLMCSDNVSYEEGIKNARKFIEDFNNYYKLDLEIDSYVDANGEKQHRGGFVIFEDNTYFSVDKKSVMDRMKRKIFKKN